MSHTHNKDEIPVNLRNLFQRDSEENDWLILGPIARQYKGHV